MDLSLARDDKRVVQRLLDRLTGVDGWVVHSTFSSPYEGEGGANVSHRLRPGDTLELRIQHSDITKDYRLVWTQEDIAKAIIKEAKDVALQALYKERFKLHAGKEVREVAIRIDWSDTQHYFRLGPGPCGRTVRGLKVTDSPAELTVWQFCTDAPEPDEFVYQKEHIRQHALFV